MGKPAKLNRARVVECFGILGCGGCGAAMMQVEICDCSSSTPVAVVEIGATNRRWVRRVVVV